MWLLILSIIDILLVYSIMVTVNLIKLKNQNIVDRERFENTLNTLINLDPKIKKYINLIYFNNTPISPTAVTALLFISVTGSSLK